jgi:hypothetical protein
LIPNVEGSNERARPIERPTEKAKQHFGSNSPSNKTELPLNQRPLAKKKLEKKRNSKSKEKLRIKRKKLQQRQRSFRNKRGNKDSKKEYKKQPKDIASPKLR